VSEELKPCPLCGGHAEIRNVGYEDQRPQCVMSKCHIGTVETFYSSEQATRYWNNLPRIDEQKKAEIALEVINKIKVETDYQYRFIVQQAMEDLFRQLKEKAKGER